MKYVEVLKDAQAKKTSLRGTEEVSSASQRFSTSVHQDFACNRVCGLVWAGETSSAPTHQDEEPSKSKASEEAEAAETWSGRPWAPSRRRRAALTPATPSRKIRRG